MSLLIASDYFVLAGNSFMFLNLFWMVAYLVNCQIYLSKLLNSFFTLRNSWALLIVALIFNLFRTIPSSDNNLVTSFCEYFAIFSGLKLSKALRKFSQHLLSSLFEFQYYYFCDCLSPPNLTLIIFIVNFCCCIKKMGGHLFN